ncbi:MAG: hypothetical protein R2771_05820 [Saprospiraceae bacterium]
MGKERYILLYNDLDSTEFRFAKNRLLEIIVNKPKFPYKSETITKFGLNYQNPTKVDSSAFIMWKNIYPNFNVVNFFLVGSKMDSRETRYNIYFKT